MVEYYNPMSDEFKEEAKRLGLAGSDLRRKYEKEGKFLEKGSYKKHVEIYTNEYLFSCLKKFFEENGRRPTTDDFSNNSEYPNFSTYIRRFGNWSKALKLVGMDMDTSVKQGDLSNNVCKGRWFEILVREMFGNKSIDLSGENYLSPCDGICPNGRTYDAKSSGLCIKGSWDFNTKGKFKEFVEWYYFGAFNDDYTELLYVWRVPGELVGGSVFRIGIRERFKFNVGNMEEYDITDEFKKMLNKKNFSI